MPACPSKQKHGKTFVMSSKVVMLANKEKKLYDALHPLGDDVGILVLAAAVWPSHPSRDTWTVRDAQNRLGGIITKVNRKIWTNNLHVSPGIARRTYRITTIKG